MSIVPTSFCYKCGATDHVATNRNCPRTRKAPIMTTPVPAISKLPKQAQAKKREKAKKSKSLFKQSKRATTGENTRYWYYTSEESDRARKLMSGSLNKISSRYIGEKNWDFDKATTVNSVAKKEINIKLRSDYNIANAKISSRAKGNVEGNSADMTEYLLGNEFCTPLKATKFHTTCKRNAAAPIFAKPLTTKSTECSGSGMSLEQENILDGRNIANIGITTEISQPKVLNCLKNLEATTRTNSMLNFKDLSVENDMGVELLMGLARPHALEATCDTLLAAPLELSSSISSAKLATRLAPWFPTYSHIRYQAIVRAADSGDLEKLHREGSMKNINVIQAHSRAEITKSDLSRPVQRAAEISIKNFSRASVMREHLLDYTTEYMEFVDLPENDPFSARSVTSATFNYIGNKNEINGLNRITYGRNLQGWRECRSVGSGLGYSSRVP